MTSTAHPEPLELRISGSTGRNTGIPLGVVGFLLKALGAAYPGTVLASDGAAGFDRAHLAVRIPADERLGDPDPEFDAPTVDDPETAAFLNGYVDGTFTVAAPAWLQALLTAISDNLLAEYLDANYLEVGLHHPGWPGAGAWIVCRPGRPSPHQLRRAAEDRVAVLEAQLPAAGIEPAPAEDLPPTGS